MADIDRAVDDAERLFIEAGKAKIAAEAADMRRKRVRAALFIKHKATAKSIAEAEALAESDPVYELACTDWESVAYDAETLRAKAEAKRMKFESWRTERATERAAMQLR